MSRTELRQLTEADLDAVLDIEVAVYPFPWSYGNFRDSIRSGYHCLAFVEAELPTAAMYGYAIYMDGVEEAHLLNIAIRPELQRQGLGRRLLGHVVERAAANGARRLLLEVRPSNSGALNLYRKEGFVELGIRRQYYPAGAMREDAIVMEKAW